MRQMALIVIDVQNDYFPGGLYPLWNADRTLTSIIAAIRLAKGKGIPVILVQHIADPKQGISPFFNENTAGVKIHPFILEEVAEAPVIVKRHADSFFGTDLEKVLAELGITDLLLCGMMTQNCVTHTALSPSASRYGVVILPDCCTTVDEMLHGIALHALSTRITLTPSSQAF